jgi:hypothetical protein
MSFDGSLRTLRQNIKSFLSFPGKQRMVVTRNRETPDVTVAASENDRHHSTENEETERDNQSHDLLTAAILEPLLLPVVEYIATLCVNNGPICTDDPHSEARIMKTYSCAVRLSDIVTLKCHKHGFPLSNADQLMECMALLARMIKRHPQARRWVHKVREAEAAISAQERMRERAERMNTLDAR